ncbi:alpha/beta fold hydrolase [Streptomyces sp. NPDC004539]|uniref:alpha/beta hydrolase n=1 Tax=Streptomyces sp. NPDC004539 TaxID=3154280 RepID=UPI0033A81256
MDTIVLVHGFWVTPRSWEHWVEHYKQRGYRVIAPAYPGFEVEVEALNSDPGAVERLTVGGIVDGLEEVIRGLDRPPLLIGHSAGGAFVQMLLDRGLGAAGVAICSAPPQGVRVAPLSQLRAAFPVLRSPANRGRAVALSAAQWRYAFTNTFPSGESDALYRRYAVPASGRIFWDNVLGNFRGGRAATYVDYRNPLRAPLLFVSGERDHLMPPAVQRANARKYRGVGRVEVRVVPGMPHLLPAAPGWEGVADSVVEWGVGVVG